jgi:hypothetical protein
MKFKKPLDPFKMTPWAREITETVEQMGPLRLMTPDMLAKWRGVSVRELATMRRQGRGPAYVRLNSRLIRYRYEDYREWRKEETHREHVAIENGAWDTDEYVTHWVGYCKVCDQTFEEPKKGQPQNVYKGRPTRGLLTHKALDSVYDD